MTAKRRCLTAVAGFIACLLAPHAWSGEYPARPIRIIVQFTPVGDTRAQFAAYIKSEIAKWGKAVKESGAKTD